MSGATRAEVIARALPRLICAGVPEPERDARRLYRWAAEIDGATLSASLAEPSSPREIARFEHAVVAREERVPVSQIIGEREFWGRAFRVTPEVLDPRPETETLIETALAGRAASRILDLGVGSGCILVTLLAEWLEATGIGVDLSTAALEIARENAERHGVAPRAEFRHSDWFGNVQGRFDLIVANPPYIAEPEMASLAPEIRLHEPRLALCAGADGLDAYRAIARSAAEFLSPGGKMLLEIGSTQSEAVREVIDATGYGSAVPIRDLDGRIRVLMVIPGGN